MIDIHKLTAEERIKLLKYALSVATRMRCYTGAILRELKQEDLEKAFEEFERGTKNSFPIRKQYHLYVNYAFIEKKWLEFHNSLNPTISFGVSNCLSEKAYFELTDERRNTLLKESTLMDYGSLIVGDKATGIYYSDITLYKDDRIILESKTWDNIMQVDEEILDVIKIK